MFYNLYNILLRERLYSCINKGCSQTTALCRREQEWNWFKSVVIQSAQPQKGCWAGLVSATYTLLHQFAFADAASASSIRLSVTVVAPHVIVLSGGLFESEFLFELLEETLDLASSVSVDKKAQVL